MIVIFSSLKISEIVEKNEKNILTKECEYSIILP